MRHDHHVSGVERRGMDTDECFFGPGNGFREGGREVEVNYAGCGGPAVGGRGTDLPC